MKIRTAKKLRVWLFAMALLLIPQSVSADEPEEATLKSKSEDVIIEEQCGEEVEQGILGVKVIDSGACGDNLKWTLMDDWTLTVSGKGNMWNKISFHEDIYGLEKYREKVKKLVFQDGVKSVGVWAFFEFSELKSVNFTDSIVAIEFGAFTGCYPLTKVELPKNLRVLGSEAFAYTSLREIVIPGSVRVLGDGIFFYCTYLQKATFEYIDRGGDDWIALEQDWTCSFFGECWDLEYIRVAPEHSKLKSYGDALLCYGDIAVSYAPKAKYQKVTLPENIRTIAAECFNNAKNLVEIDLANVVDIHDGAFSKSGIYKLQWPKGSKEISFGAFFRCPNLKEVTIPNSVEEIRGKAFLECDSLQELYVPSSVKLIEGPGDAGYCAFSESLVVICDQGSAAYAYAKQKKLSYRLTGTSFVYRLYNPNSGEHFYTMNGNEVTFLKKAGWNYEGVGWAAPAKSKTPVYRLYNPNVGDHHYTRNAAERDWLKKVGWNYEGISWNSEDSLKVPIYRQYNPNAVTGAHNYTTGTKERDFLTKIGWKDEGIGWYGSEMHLRADALDPYKN